MSEPVRPADEDRSATIETPSDDPVTIVAAIQPDNTSSIRTAAADDSVQTSIERDTTGGLASTVDDYLVNLSVAETIAATARTYAATVGTHNQNVAPTDNQPNDIHETYE